MTSLQTARSTARSLRCCASQATRSCRRSSSSANAAASSTGASSASTSASEPAAEGAKQAATSSAKWEPALPRGAEPAYDAALAFLQQHRQAKLEEAKSLESGERAHETTDALIDAHIDDPETRWRFAQGDVDLSLPVFRFLREQTWRKSGALDRLLERVRLMKVVPDVVPSIAPTVDLQVAYGQGRGIGDHGGDGGDIWPGIFLKTARTLEPPQITATPFHPEQRKYTLLLVDPDAPEELSMSFTTFVHWHLTDISLSATQTTVTPESSRTLFSYLPPHPQKGTPYHRYTSVLLEQPADGPAPAELPSRTLPAGFLQSYIEQHGLKPVGIHFFRQKCDRENESVVEKIYKDVLKSEAPVYGHLPTPDPYRDAAGYRRSRYFSSADELATGAQHFTI